jgi:hypothetical protein
MDFTYLSHIFYHPDRTYCVSCDEHFPIHEFEWADTGECLTGWYSRHAAKFKGLDRLLGDELFVYAVIIVGLLVGGGVGFYLGNMWGIWAALGGMVLGAILAGFAGFVVGATIKAGVCRRVLGTDDFRALV